MSHVLKCWPAPFAAIANGSKRHEVRVNDRYFAEGERVILREYNPTTGTYSGKELNAIIGHVSPGGSWGLPPTLCAFTLLEVR
jgi:hypothetical protein